MDFSRKEIFPKSPRIFVHNRAVQPLMFDVRTKDFYPKKPIWCEYLESDGNQWIDTGWKPSSNNITINTTASSSKPWNQLDATEKGLFGNYISSYQSGLLALWIKPNGNFYSGTSVDSGAWGSTNLVEQAGTSTNKKIISFKISPNDYVVTIDGNVHTYTRTFGFNPSYVVNNLMLFAATYVQNYYSRFDGGRIHSCQIYEGDVMVRNFRPCLHPVTYEPCLYDTVSEQYFYNQGTGTFKYEKGFIEIDYIESDGNQYMETNIFSSINTDLIAKLSFNLYDQSLSEYSFNGLGARFGNFIGISNNYKIVAANNTDPSSLIVNWGQPYILKNEITSNGTRNIYNDGDLVTTGSTTLSQNYRIGLFANFDNGDAIFCKYNGKLYYAQIIQSKILVFDAIPVYRFDGTICMYDFITGSYLTNRGTGDFKGCFTDVDGNVYQVLSWIQSDGKAYIDTGIAPITARMKFTLQSTMTLSDMINPYHYFGVYNGRAYNQGSIELFTSYNNNDNIGVIVTVYPKLNDVSIFRYFNYVFQPVNKLKFVLEPPYLTYNGTKSLIASDYYMEYISNRSMGVFRVNRPNWELDNSPSVMFKLHYFSINDEDNRPIQELIPVITSRGIAGLYDTVNNQTLFNANSIGKFIHPVAPQLPGGYTGLEYIESTTDGQYIDTGVIINNTNKNSIKIEVDGNFGTSNNWSVDGSSGTGYYHRYIGIGNRSNALSYGNNGGDILTNYIENDRTGRHLYVIDYLNGVIKRDYYDLITFTPDNLNSSDRSIYIFGWSANGTQVNARKYGFRIFVADQLVFNGIPCKNPSNVVGMYDTVTKQFFSSPNGSAFVAGPVLS